MDRYESDEQQIEAVKKWWHENGKAIIAGIVLGLGGLFGWQSWQTHQTRQAEAASAAYQQVMAFTELKDIDQAKTAARAVIEQHPNSVYAALASFALAKFAAQEGSYDEARARLKWIMEESTDRKIQQMARLRIVRLDLNNQDYDSAWQTLNGGDDLSHMSTYHELKGDILVGQNNTDGARAAYREALALRQNYDTDVELLEFKLNELGPADQSDDPQN